MKTLDTETYMSVLRELLEEGREVSLLISGTSMEPLLRDQRDYIWFKSPDRELEKGDMVFYQRANGQYVMHRIYHVGPEGYYLVGDHQVVVEGPLKRDQIFGLVTKVKRNGRWIGPESLIWKFFAHVWPHTIQMRTILGRIQRKLRRVHEKV